MSVRPAYRTLKIFLDSCYRTEEGLIASGVRENVARSLLWYVVWCVVV
jgi:hypothetical protein